MTERGGGVPRVGAPPAGLELPAGLLPSRDRVRLVVSDVVLTDALATLAAAGTRAEAASACLPLLVQRPGVRAVAVVLRSGRHAVVVGSAGYDCSSMAPGAELPLDAGLPVTEAVRTGRTVARGDGPGWLAVPFGRGAQEPGALLLSLTSAPPGATAELDRLHRLARAIGDALHRSAGAEEAVAGLAAVSEALRLPTAQDERRDVVVRTLPTSGDVGGDVVTCLPDGRGGTWLLAADVVGSGLVAALLARSVRAAARTAAAWAVGPAVLLDAVEAGIRDDVPPGSFVTAAVVHLSGGRLRAASAGHPLPLLLRDGVATLLALEPGAPLALETAAATQRPELAADVESDVVVLLHTDGLVERRCGEHVRLLDPVGLATGLPHDLEAAADALLVAADAHGPARDDVSLLLARARR